MSGWVGCYMNQHLLWQGHKECPGQSGLTSAESMTCPVSKLTVTIEVFQKKYIQLIRYQEVEKHITYARCDCWLYYMLNKTWLDKWSWHCCVLRVLWSPCAASFQSAVTFPVCPDTVDCARRSRSFTENCLFRIILLCHSLTHILAFSRLCK